MKLVSKVKKRILRCIPSYRKREKLRKIHPTMKVLMAGFMQSSNLGDAVISDCAAYLLRKAAKECAVKKLKITELDIKRQKDKTSLNQVRNSDLVIFPGGGFIKYKQESFPKDIPRIATRAEHYGIPVMYNAMGVEGYDPENEGCMKLQEMLLNFSNRYITSRDFSDFLNETYLKDACVKARRVADPAVWCQETYDIKKSENSEYVGLGVARSGLFVHYGLPVEGEELFIVWENIIKELDERGIKWKLFTNGLGKDEEFLTSLLERLGLTDRKEEFSLPAPTTSRELVENVASFKALIATRMHANIIAFSLGIPSVAFVWNDKLRAFMESIDCRDRSIEYTELNDTKHIINTLEKAVCEGVKKEIIEREKASAYGSIMGYMKPFSKEFLSSRRRDFEKCGMVWYGLPNLESDRLNHKFIEDNVEFFVSDDETIVGTQCLSKPVYSPEKIKGKLRKPFVIISETVDYTPAAKKLMEWGYKERYHFTNMHAYRRYAFNKGEIFFPAPVSSEITK